MEKSDWGHPKRIWGLENRYDAGRMIPIHEAIKNLPIKNIVDVACGVGIVADGLKWVMNAEIEQFDIINYPEWEFLSVKPQIKDVDDFMREDKHYDLVLFLNSYRNWDKKEEFNHWLKGHAKYFITSGAELPNGTEIGMDVKGHALKLYEIQK